VRLFIASPAEGLSISQALRSELLDRPIPGGRGRRLRELLAIEVWNQAFHPGLAFMKDLEAAADHADFAVFLCEPIGRGNRGQQEFSITSANVLFEYGLFLGRLGSERCFLLASADTEVYLPTDVQGITRLSYEAVVDPTVERNLRTAVHDAAVAIAARVAELGPNPEKIFFLKRSTLRRVVERGLENVYERREDARQEILDRITNSRRSLELHARAYLSELIQDRGGLAQAILSGVVRGAAAGITEPFEIRLITTDPDDAKTVAQLWRIEDPPDGDLRWPRGPDQYRSEHLLGRVEQKNRDLWRALQLAISDRSAKHGPVGRRIVVRRAYFRDYLTPYSVVIVDREVLWLGLYTFTRVFAPDPSYGTFSPAMKLGDLEDGKASWFDRFLEEVARTRASVVCDEEVIEEFAA
jgi:Predicted nucleotide-binding protein containing TIR-like domain